MTEPNKLPHILVSDLVGNRDELWVNPGKHTITNESGQVDFDVTAVDTDGDGISNRITIKKYELLHELICRRHMQHDLHCHC
ncbi:MAG: hypothetical protein HQM16_06405 [Deltaproteobacteria bacterium]|nr:hypothetical protein [Deltaproteobacteria bacterium]